MNAAAFPGEAFTYHLEKGKALRWTRSETAGLPRDGFREPELVLYPTFDSVGVSGPRRIPAWLYLPGPLQAGSPQSFIRPISPSKSLPGRGGAGPIPTTDPSRPRPGPPACRASAFRWW